MIEQLEQTAQRPVSRETLRKLEAFVLLLRDANQRQNLISATSGDQIWSRHILDSAQLVRFEPFERASWLDIGSGGGLPGIVIACLVDGPVTLAEPRRLRAEFLNDAIRALNLRAAVEARKVERITGTFDAITARAVAPLDRLLEISQHLSTRKTVWALPKGRSAQSELADAQRSWQGTFHVERSVTDPESFILVGTGVRARK